MNIIKRFLMSCRELCREAYTGAKDKYHATKEKYHRLKVLKSDFKGNITKLSDYAKEFLDTIKYKSPGMAGIYNYTISESKSLTKKFKPIINNAKTLENILFGNMTQNKNPNTNPDISAKVPEHKEYDNTYKRYEKRHDNKYQCQNPRPDIEYLNKIILLKNKYFWKSPEDLDKIIEKEIGTMQGYVRSTRDAITYAMRLKSIDNKYHQDNHEPDYQTSYDCQTVCRINYDSRIAPQEMKEECLKQYMHSEKTLKEISQELESRYGMHISISTISRHSRKYLERQGLHFKNRIETKEYYSSGLAAPSIPFKNH
jgi:hypothetical protein